MKDDMNKPFRVTIEHYDEKVTLEIDHSDITVDELCELFYKAGCAAGFSEQQIQHILER